MNQVRFHDIQLLSVCSRNTFAPVVKDHKISRQHNVVLILGLN